MFGEKEEEFWGKRGHLYSAGGRRVIAITVLRIGNDALAFKERIYGRMKR
jgi:hypothetical protein